MCKELDYADQLDTNLTILTKTEWIKEHIEGDFQKEEEVSKNKKQKEYETTV